MIGALFGVDEQMQVELNMLLKTISALTVTEFILQTFRNQDTPLRVTDSLQWLRQPCQERGVWTRRLVKDSPAPIPSLGVSRPTPLLFCHIFGLQPMQT